MQRCQSGEIHQSQGIAVSVLQELSQDFERHAGLDLLTARSALAALAERPQRGSEALSRIVQVAHDLSGQGASFGYPLVTQVARLLQRVARDAMDSPAPTFAPLLRVMSACLDSLAIILDHRITGQPSPTGIALVARLERLAA